MAVFPVAKVMKHVAVSAYSQQTGLCDNTLCLNVSACSA